MQKAKFVFTLSLLFVANLSLFAQNIEFTKSNFISRTDEFEQIVEDLDTGNVLFANGNAYCKYNLEYQYCNKGYKFYKEALPYLSKAQLFNPNNAELNFQIGICYFYSPFKYKALSFFEKAYTLQSTINPLCSYYLATCYHLNKQWDQAISLYQQTIEQLKTLKDIKHISQNELEHYIVQCQNGKIVEKDTINKSVRVQNLGETINSVYPEYGAITISDGRMMLFTSRRDSVNDEDVVSENELVPDEILKNPESIYLSYKAKDTWLQARKIHYPINKDNEHDAILSVAPDGKSILIYKKGDIFESLYINGKWSDPDAVEGDLNTANLETSAIYSPNMKTILFTSDRAGGFGGKDIYEATINANGVCTQVINLGAKINTAFDEDGLFLTESGDELYFSSNGHNSIGGYDVFVSYRIDSVTWSDPVNLGMPINTPGDDIFFVLNPNKKTGFYTSYQASGFGEKDLYSVEFARPISFRRLSKDTISKDSVVPVRVPIVETKVDTLLLYKPLNKLRITGTIIDFESKKAVDAHVSIVERGAKDTIRRIVATNGAYEVLLYDSSFYKFIIEAVGYTTKEEIIKTPAGVKKFDINHYIVKESIVVSRIDTISDIYVESVGKNNSVIEGRIFDFLSDENVDAIVKIVDTKTDSVISVVKSDRKTGKFKVVVPSGREYKIIADANGYLFQSNRISTWATKPYVKFEDKLFKSNEAILKENLEGSFSTVHYAGIANIRGVLFDSVLNRSISAKITVTSQNMSEVISSIQTDNGGAYVIAVPTGQPYIIDVVAEGYIPLHKSIDVPMSAKIVDIHIVMKHVPPVEKSIKLSDIYYETGQFILNEVQRKRLKSIQEMLVGTTIAEITVIGHTDDQGGSELNLQLSKNRASEVARYIQQSDSYRNVRYDIQGRGETEPIAPNQSDEGRAQNRRTEIIVRQIN